MQARVLFVYLSVCLSAGGSIKYFCSQPNEAFLECGCHRTCRNPARTCEGACQKGCFCRGNELRDDDGDCVDPEYCPEIPFDEFFSLEPYGKEEPVTPQELNTSNISEENISDTSEPEEKEGAESPPRKLYTLQPFGKFGAASQTKKLYTYNPYYDEDSAFGKTELSTLHPRDEVVPSSNTKNVYSLKLYGQGSSVSRNNQSYTLKPRSKWNVLSYRKVFYSSKSRGEGKAVSQNKEPARYTSCPVSQKNNIYAPKSINKGGAVFLKKPIFEINKRDPVFPEYLFTQNKTGPVSPKKEINKSKYLGKTGPVSPSKELYKLKSLGVAQELYASKSRGKTGLVSPSKELYKLKTLSALNSGIGDRLFQNIELYNSKSRGKGDALSPKELYISKSLGKEGPLSQNKELYTSKSRGKGAHLSPNTELHASKSSGNGSVVSYYKEIHTFKSGNGTAVTPKKSFKFRSNGNLVSYYKPNLTKYHGTERPAHNKKLSRVKLQCPQNEEYRYCEHCNRTCEDPKPVCLAGCSRGCFCQWNLLRDVDGSCVKLQRCSNIWKRMKRMDMDRK